MPDKISYLEGLVVEATDKLKALEKDNARLQLKAAGLERELDRLSLEQTELRRLREWKAGTRARVAKLAARLEEYIKRAERAAKGGGHGG